MFLLFIVSKAGTNSMATSKSAARKKKRSTPKPGSLSRSRLLKNSNADQEREMESLRARLAEAEETLRAIRNGEVDALIVAAPLGEQIFTLKNAEHVYRVLVEEMNEGAAILSSEGTILFVNNALASMLGLPVEKIVGAPFRRYLANHALPLFDQFVKQSLNDGGRIEVELKTNSSSPLPAILSGRELSANPDVSWLRIIVTDISEYKRSEGALQKAYGDLEQRVADRTQELARTNESLVEEIADRKRAEAAIVEVKNALERERDLLQSVMNSARKSHLVYLDRNFNFITVNDTYARTCGYAPEEMTGKNHFALYPDNENVAIFTRVRDTGIPVEFHDKPFVFPDQPERGITYWDWTLTPINDGAGSVAGLVFSLFETTERKQAEERIRRQNILLTEIARILSATLAAQTEEDLGRVCLAVAEEITQSKFGFIGEVGPDGLLQDIAISDPGWEACALSDKTGHRKPSGNFNLHGLYGRIVNYGKPLFTNDCASHPDGIGLPEGHPLLTAFLGVPLKHEGKTIGLIAVGNRDNGYCEEDAELLTALSEPVVQAFRRKRAEEEIKRLNQDLKRRVSELETIFDTVPIGLAIAGDTQGLTIRANKTNARMLGLDDNGEASKRDPRVRFRVFQNEREVPVEELPMQRAVRGESVSGMIIDIERQDGVSLKLHCSATPLLDEQGKPRGAVGAFLDITDMKRAEDSIKRLNDELRRKMTELATANRELEAFMYSVSHDLRAPLRSILGFSEVLREDYAANLDERGKNYLERICNAAAKMNRLIEDLLRLSRISRQEINKQDIDLSRMAAAVMTELRQAGPERGVDVEIQEGVTIYGDKRLIEVALSNLLANAWKFTSRKERSFIQFGAVSDSCKTIYFVMDNGAGFDQNYAEKLFVPFQRLHSDQEFEGTGIGLAIVDRVIRRHGGRLWAEGEPDKGAVFYFTLPAPGKIGSATKKDDAQKAE
jgi:PAS domain S-box-containing protein